MGQTVRFQDTLRRLAMIDESFVQDSARLGLDLARDNGAGSQDRCAAASRGVVWPSGPRPYAWNGARAGRWRRARPAAEIADVLLAIAPMAGLGRVVSATPGVATALDYDIAAALEEPD